MDGAVEVGEVQELSGGVPDLLAQAHHRRATSEWSVAVLAFLHRIVDGGRDAAPPAFTTPRWCVILSICFLLKKSFVKHV